MRVILTCECGLQYELDLGYSRFGTVHCDRCGSRHDFHLHDRYDVQRIDVVSRGNCAGIRLKY